MNTVFGSLFELGSSSDWLVTANFILSVLLALWMLRYRSLYLRSRSEQANNADLIENLSEGIYRSSIEGRQLRANKALVRLNGYDSEAEMLGSVRDIAREWYVQPTRREEFRTLLFRDGKVDDFVSEIYRHKTRERIWVAESARLVRAPGTGTPLFYEGSVREITETVRRLQLEERFQKLTRELPGALFQFVCEEDGRFTVPYLSEGVSRLTGIPFDRHLAEPEIFDTCVHPDDVDAYRRSLRDCTLSLEPWEHEFRINSRDGVEKWLRIMARPEKIGSRVVWYGYVTDISGRRRQETEIRELAYFDPLTRLPNRRMFMNRMAEVTAACERHGDHGALLFIDLDNFKTLNDTQGHDVGDDFLVEVADRLLRCVDRRDLVARIGGDEFVVVLEQSGKGAAPATLRGITTANRILSELRLDFQLGELRHVGSASIGVVVFDGSESRADEILKRADLAMYEAKSSGRNGVALFDPATMDKETDRYRLLADLRAALERNELDLHFQPQVDHDGRLTGAEALLRWHHPSRGLVMPGQFVMLAEQSGLSSELAAFVLERGLRTLAGWQREPATAQLRLALNVSVHAFAAEDFMTMVGRLLEAYPIDASLLTFELTEHVMAKDHARIAARMEEVKRLGVRLSLDDFGTGYSSLAYLKRLPFDEVKIDGGFVADIETGDSDRALVKTILAMARTLGLKAVAEHVENVRQQAFLRAFGCDYFQGFLYGPAIPGDRFLELARKPDLAGADQSPATLRHQA